MILEHLEKSRMIKEFKIWQAYDVGYETIVKDIQKWQAIKESYLHFFTNLIILEKQEKMLSKIYSFKDK